MLLETATLAAPDGSSVELGEWRVGSGGHAEGVLIETLDIGGPERQGRTQPAPYRRGVTATPARAGARRVELAARVVAPTYTRANALRRELLAVLRDHGGDPLRLRVTPEDDELELRVYLDGEVSVERQGMTLLAEAELIAPDPVLYLPDEQSRSVSEGSTTTWTVDGDVPVYPRWVISGPDSGTAEAIELTVGGRTLRLEGVGLASGDELIIEGDEGAPRVTAGGSSAIGTLDRDAAPWQWLDAGANTVELAVTSGDSAGVSCEATWRPGVML